MRSVLLACLPAFGAVAATLSVPGEYPTIQDAIDAANAGDTVLVDPGTYTENLVLRPAVDVAGREAARTIIVPQNALQPVFTLVAVSDVRVSNFTLAEAALGFDLITSTDIEIRNIVFDSITNVAVAVEIGSAVDILNNVFFMNTTAIARNSINVNVINNIFRENQTTISSPSLLVDNNLNVDANCWSANADLDAGGIDGFYGTNGVTGNPMFVDTDARDFHLQQGSPCIDIGLGEDIVDNSDADAGAYGGQFADVLPYPVAEPALTDASTTQPDVYNIEVSWLPNTSYLVTNTLNPGGYLVYYKQNVAGPPYDGTDAGGGVMTSPVAAGDDTSLTLENLAPSAPLLSPPQLTSAEGIDAGVVLTWEPVAAATGYRVHYGIDSTNENQADAGDVTGFTVTGLENGTTYRFAVSALGQATYFVTVTATDNTPMQHESALSTEASLSLGPVEEGPLSAELTGLPQLILAYPVLRDEGGCFIATAAFGADWEHEVMLLRQFRDRYLLTNALGRWFVARYYRYSPPLADRLSEMPRMRALVRWLLMPAVGFAAFMVLTSVWVKAVTIVPVVALSAIGLQRRSRRRNTRPAAA